MECRNTCLHIMCITFLLFVSAVSAKELPPLTLAQVYSDDIIIEDYWVSEKLDGVRAYWDGKHLISRSGNIFNAPAWFIHNFPEQKLDGELWAGRGKFQQTMSIVQSMHAADRWKSISYQVFDLPDTNGTFTQRMESLKSIIKAANIPWLQRVKQEQITGRDVLMHKLDLVVSAGGEGLMLRYSDASYHSGRSHDLLKLKPFLDAEATVLKYFPGKGQIKGLMGAMQVENTAGHRFKIGTGFSLKERQNPPAIGTVITYRYHGLTNRGLPRFASFLRIRPDEYPSPAD